MSVDAVCVFVGQILLRLYNITFLIFVVGFDVGVLCTLLVFVGVDVDDLLCGLLECARGCPVHAERMQCR